jgi:hypothetical protein
VDIEVPEEHAASFFRTEVYRFGNIFFSGEKVDTILILWKRDSFSHYPIYHM